MVIDGAPPRAHERRALDVALDVRGGPTDSLGNPAEATVTVNASPRPPRRRRRSGLRRGHEARPRHRRRRRERGLQLPGGRNLEQHGHVAALALVLGLLTPRRRGGAD